MKLHDLQPADGSRKPRTRVGRGIAAGKGKTAGRGTKGQKARAGGGIPAWFEGGQTPLHMRIPKLRGFKNRFKIEYEVVNIGAIGALAERGAFEFEGDAKKSAKSAPITVNQDILRAVGLVRTLEQAAQDPRRRRAVDAALRRRRRVHRVRPRQDRGGRWQRQRPRGPDHAARGAGRDTPRTERADGRRPPTAPARREAAADAAEAEPKRREGQGGQAGQGRPPRPPTEARRRRRARRRPTADRGDRRGRRDRRTPTRPPTASRRDRRRRSRAAGRRGRRRRPATTPDPCSNPFSTPFARPISGAGSSMSSAC